MATESPEKDRDASGGKPAGGQSVTPEALAAGHETTDVSLKGLAIFGVSLVALLLGVLAAVAVFYFGFHWLDGRLDKNVARTEPGAASYVEATPNYQGPLLQVKPEEDLRWMREHNEMMLHTYGWVDQPKGVVRLPIDRAMALLAERGLPPVSPGKTLEELQRERAKPQGSGQSLRP